MTEIFGGKIINVNKTSVVIETPFNPKADVMWATYAIPKDRIIEVIGIPERFFNGFTWIGKEVSVLKTDEFEFKIKFFLERTKKRERELNLARKVFRNLSDQQFAAMFGDSGGVS